MTALAVVGIKSHDDAVFSGQLAQLAEKLGPVHAQSSRIYARLASKRRPVPCARQCRHRGYDIRRISFAAAKAVVQEDFGSALVSPPGFEPGTL
ncbi:hypothetical protein STAQ_33710 [Allostella sp. ATCC 35155]|nr:hypothetical protein STAQ_33710 [Stella sp. ATCC 35155]